MQNADPTMKSFPVTIEHSFSDVFGFDDAVQYIENFEYSEKGVLSYLEEKYKKYIDQHQNGALILPPSALEIIYNVIDLYKNGTIGHWRNTVEEMRFMLNAYREFKDYNLEDAIDCSSKVPLIKQAVGAAMNFIPDDGYILFKNGRFITFSPEETTVFCMSGVVDFKDTLLLSRPVAGNFLLSPGAGLISVNNDYVARDDLGSVVLKEDPSIANQGLELLKIIDAEEKIMSPCAALQRLTVGKKSVPAWWFESSESISSSDTAFMFNLENGYKITLFPSK